MFRMKSCRENIVKVIGWLLLKFQLITREDYMNTMVIVRAWEESLRIVEASTKEKEIVKN